MKRFVYTSMIISFLALMVTGVLRFVLPFSLSMSRLHLVSGIVLGVLILIHLVGKSKTLGRLFLPRNGSMRWQGAALASCLCLGIGMAAWSGSAGISQLISLGYEARHHAAIFRAQDNVASFQNDHLIRTTKLTSSGASLDLELLWKKAPENAAVAIWAETQSGTIIETLYLTGSLRFSDAHQWEGRQQRRGNILPIWRHRYTAVCGIDPAGASDLISQPTINHQWLLDNHLNEASRPFTLFVEINIAEDNQSSLIYAARIEPRSVNPYTLLNLIGHSHQSLNDGEINYDLSQLPSGINPVERILVKTIWKPA